VSDEASSELDRVRKSPGMYTDTGRPNHLAQEVIDNSVAEALAGFATRVDVTLFADGSCQVADNGRGMPVDIHPVYNVSGVELILTKLHSSAKFTANSHNFSARAHGVGVAVVNALSKKLEVRVCRCGAEYAVSFADGTKTSKLKQVGTVSKSRTGTTVRFWPDEKYFDSPKISIPELKQVLRAKAEQCPNLRVSLDDQSNGEQMAWQSP
jgi:topoisomerase IV subunit B